MYKRLRGTKDYLFTEVEKLRFLEDTARRIFKSFGYKEIITPIIEEESLFIRGLGEGSEIVKKQMYSFKDKKGRNVVLRPEGTAPVVRALIENGVFSNTKSPWKFFYSGPMFRYERPQKGRTRQFHQIGCEYFGVKEIYADFEVIFIGKKILDDLNIDYEIFINYLGCSECRSKYSKVLKEFFSNKKEELCSDCRERLNYNVLRILDCKKENIKGIPEIENYLCNECKNNFDNLKEILRLNEMDFSIDPYLVRGLDYYTGIVFEFKTKLLGSQDAILAGGRYDELTKEIGGPDIPATGFALGVERVIELFDLKTTELVEYGIIFIGDEAKKKVFEIIEEFFKKNKSFIVFWEEGSLKSKMRKAQSKCKKAIIIGEDEIKGDYLTVKDFMENKEEKIKLSRIVK